MGDSTKESVTEQDSENDGSVTDRRLQFHLLNTIFQESTDAIFIKNTEGRYLTINAAGARMLGRRAEEIIGKTDADLFEPDDAETLAELDRHIIESGEPFADEEQLICQGRPTVVLSTKVVYRDAHGRPAGVIGIARDISQRKEAERALTKYRGQLEHLVHERTADLEAANRRLAQEVAERRQIAEDLRASEKQLRGLIEGIDDAIFLHDEEGRVLDCNESACRRLSYSREELLRMHTKDFDAPEFAQGFADRLHRQFREGRYGCEGMHLTKDGRRIPVDIMTSVIEYRGRKAVLAVVRDITERKQAEKEREKLEAQIRHAQKLESLGLLAGGIAHDFNNLLLAILGNIQLVMEELPPLAGARESLQDMEAAAKQAADLARQMLAYSGKGKLAIRPVDLHEVLHEMQGLLSSSVSKKVKIEYQLAAEVAAVRADASQISQIIMNLVTNASDAIGTNAGAITIRTGSASCGREYLRETYLGDRAAEGEYVFIEVSDTGCGMDRETLERIFDPFFTTKFSGRGLGLASVLGIIRGHRGTIKVYSERGKGSCFKVLLPASEQPAVALRKVTHSLTELSGSGTVLVIDDEEGVRTVSRRILERGGFTVLTAADGAEAVALFRERAAEIEGILLDLTMPAMDGEETLRELRSIKPEVRVIVSSGYNEQEVAERLGAAAPTGFIQKPYHASELIAKMCELCRQPAR